MAPAIRSVMGLINSFSTVPFIMGAHDWTFGSYLFGREST
jgi:hypothetical protein